MKSNQPNTEGKYIIPFIKDVQIIAEKVGKDIIVYLYDIEEKRLATNVVIL